MEKKILVISSNTNIMNAAIDFLLETKRFYKVKSVFRDSIKNSGKHCFLWNTVYLFHFYSVKIRIWFLQVTYLWTIYTG